MSEIVDILQRMIACACGRTGIKQTWYDATNQLHIDDFCVHPPQFCTTCNFNQWTLQPYAPFVLTQSFPALLACGCGGRMERIRQRFEDVLQAYPNFHFDSITTSGFCITCNYVCWEALPNVPSIVALPQYIPSPKSENKRSRLFLEVKKPTGIIVQARGRIIERVED